MPNKIIIKFLIFTRNCLLYAARQLDRQILQPPNPIHLWEEDKEFNKLYNLISSHSLVDKQRCFMLYQYAQQVAHLSGDVAEVGVYKGGTAKLLAKSFEQTDKTLHLFDTYSGMPPTDRNKDLHSEGDFGDISLEKVKLFLNDCGNVRFYKGLFPHTAGPVDGVTFCFVHIDVDIYKSVYDCCEFFYSRMVRCGVMFFDDYGFLSCPGAKMAVDEFFSNKPEHPCYLSTGQCVVVRV